MTENTYLDTSFDSDRYQAYRLTYPQSLYETVIDYHQLERGTVVDVGCGTGIATFPLLQYFREVVGIDPSVKMIEAAVKQREHLSKEEKSRIEFKCVAAEKLSTEISYESVDMVVGAESIHWVNHNAFFEEAYRILKPGGTLAYWFYVEPIFIDYPKANEIFNDFVYKDKRYFANYWPPEMQYVRSFGKSIAIPIDKFKDIKSEIYDPLKSRKRTSFTMARCFTVSEFAKLVSTWSIYHAWQKDHKGDKMDILDIFVQKLQAECGWQADTKLRIEWGTSYYLARKR